MENQYGPGDDAPPVAILSRLKRGIKKDNPSKFLAVYLGLSLVIVFLVAVSLAPQLSQKLGTLQTKKQTQQSQATASQIRLTADAPTIYTGQRVGISWQSPYSICYLTQYPTESASPWKGKVAGNGYLDIYPKQAGYYYFSAICENNSLTDKNYIKVNVIAPPPAQTLQYPH